MAKRVLVTGAMAQHPLGGAGNAWCFLQYVLGFNRLGFETYYAEEIKAEACIDEEWKRTDFETSANVRFMRALIAAFDFSDRVSLLEADGERHVGLSRRALESLAPDIDLLVNLSGRFHLRTVLAAVKRRLYVDIDPGFTQIWQEQYGVDMNLAGHDAYVTVGLNLGHDDCPLPTCGLRWHPTLPPVVLDEWETSATPGSAYTTVADWRGYSPVEWKGFWYGQKAEEFLRVIELPTRVAVPLEVCMAIHPDEPDLPKLLQHRWRLVSPRVHAATLEDYRAYIRSSRGECTPVKHGYAAGRTGWFSDRSTCYLAAGRPVIMQETGMSRYVPTGEGVLTFTDIDGAVAALDAVESNYAQHAVAARAFARAHLDSDKVLSRLWDLRSGTS
jgi:hypothetical protein